MPTKSITACCSAGTGWPRPAPAQRPWPVWSPGTGRCWRLFPPGNICSSPSCHRRPRCPAGSCPPSSLSSRAQSRSAGGNWPPGWGHSLGAFLHTGTRHRASSGGDAAPSSASLTSPTRWCSTASSGFRCWSPPSAQRSPATRILWKVRSFPVLLTGRRADQRAIWWILGWGKGWKKLLSEGVLSAGKRREKNKSMSLVIIDKEKFGWKGSSDGLCFLASEEQRMWEGTDTKKR